MHVRAVLLWKRPFYKYHITPAPTLSALPPSLHTPRRLYRQAVDRNLGPLDSVHLIWLAKPSVNFHSCTHLPRETCRSQCPDSTTVVKLNKVELAFGVPTYSQFTDSLITELF
jgi:hypothetical protein